MGVPLVCHGHSRPVVDVSYSPVTPDGFFLISASKGMIQFSDLDMIRIWKSSHDLYNAPVLDYECVFDEFIWRNSEFDERYLVYVWQMFLLLDLFLIWWRN